MYTIKQAAARSGVPAALLRAWERRYGVVAPTRTASGYRLYDDEAIERLRTMRRLVDAGWAPSTAAGSILDGSVMPDPDVLAEFEAQRREGAEGPAAGPVAEELAQRFVRAARGFDMPGVDAVLDELFARGSFERVADDLLFPALRRLGDAWASGEVSVAGEHLASAAVLRRLGLALDAAGSRDGRGPTVVVGLAPNGRHELGALAFAVAARRAGLAVRYLGPDLPVEDWVAAAADADAVVIGVVTAKDRRAAVEVAQGVRAAYPEVVVALGGPAAPVSEDFPRLDGTLAASVAALGSALDQRRARAS